MSAPVRSPAVRPLLLLDVDGVLQPVGRSVPPGFQRLDGDHAQVVLRLEHGTWLRDLAERFDLVWATTWAAAANPAIGVPLGLPPLPHVDLGILPRHGTRKLGAVRDHVGDTRSVAWVDDELYEDAHAWAAERAAPTLLVRPRASVGLTAEHVAALVAFASEVVARR